MLFAVSITGSVSPVFHSSDPSSHTSSFLGIVCFNPESRERCQYSRVCCALLCMVYQTLISWYVRNILTFLIPPPPHMADAWPHSLGTSLWPFLGLSTCRSRNPLDQRNMPRQKLCSSFQSRLRTLWTSEVPAPGLAACCLLSGPVEDFWNWSILLKGNAPLGQVTMKATSVCVRLSWFRMQLRVNENGVRRPCWGKN